eukprot:scaffold682620_cov53-Prasinocladus_malaysianus.AAC.1
MSHSDYAFIHFKDSSAAEQAAKDCQGCPVELNGAVLEVQLAKGNADPRTPGQQPAAGGGR